MKKTKRTLSACLALILSLSAMPMSAFAESTNVESTTTEDTTQNKAASDETLDVSTNSTKTVEVYVTLESYYSVKIPKIITLDGSNKTGGYTITVSGDIAANEVVSVAPTSTSFQLKSTKSGSRNKADVTATISQTKSEWEWDEFGTNATGTITAAGLTAGQWNGTFDFDIMLKVDDGLPDDTDTIIYRTSSLDLDISYTEVAANQENMTAVYGGTLSNDLVIPVAYKDGETWYKVTSIGDSAFQDCNGLNFIEMPDSVTSIGKNAFHSCRNLISIEIPDSVTSIGNSAFNGCSSLTSIEIPDSVTSIGAYVFSNCSNLTSIVIPDNVTSIGMYAFSWCSNLTSITFCGTMEQWNAITKESTWNKNTGNYTIHCTDGDIPKS